MQTLVFFTTSAKDSSSLKLHSFVFPMSMIFFFQLMNLILKIFNILINQITYNQITSITFTLHKSGFSNNK